jgi:hypothetical protein
MSSSHVSHAHNSSTLASLLKVDIVWVPLSGFIGSDQTFISARSDILIAMLLKIQVFWDGLILNINVFTLSWKVGKLKESKKFNIWENVNFHWWFSVHIQFSVQTPLMRVPNSFLNSVYKIKNKSGCTTDRTSLSFCLSVWLSLKYFNDNRGLLRKVLNAFSLSSEKLW